MEKNVQEIRLEDMVQLLTCRSFRNVNAKSREKFYLIEICQEILFLHVY